MGNTSPILTDNKSDDEDDADALEFDQDNDDFFDTFNCDVNTGGDMEIYPNLLVADLPAVGVVVESGLDSNFIDNNFVDNNFVVGCCGTADDFPSWPSQRMVAIPSKTVDFVATVHHPAMYSRIGVAVFEPPTVFDGGASNAIFDPGGGCDDLFGCDWFSPTPAQYYDLLLLDRGE